MTKIVVYPWPKSSRQIRVGRLKFRSIKLNNFATKKTEKLFSGNLGQHRDDGSTIRPRHRTEVTNSDQEFN